MKYGLSYAVDSMFNLRLPQDAVCAISARAQKQVRRFSSASLSIHGTPAFLAVVYCEALQSQCLTADTFPSSWDKSLLACLHTSVYSVACFAHLERSDCIFCCEFAQEDCYDLNMLSSLSMPARNLQDLLVEVRRNDLLRDRLLAAPSLEAAEQLILEAGFAISRSDLLELQSMRDSSLSDDALGLLAAGSDKVSKVDDQITDSVT